MLEHLEAHFNPEDARFIESMLAWIDVDLKLPEWERCCHYNDHFADQRWYRLRVKLRDHLGECAWSDFQQRIFWWAMKERLDLVFPNSQGEVGEMPMCHEVMALIEKAALARTTSASAHRSTFDAASNFNRL